MARVELAANVAPGQQYTFTFPVTAPAAGTYTMQWQMMERYVQWFGGLASASVPVSASPSTDNVVYIHTDALGSPVARSDSAGNVISRTSYEPYGRTASGATPTIGFTGHVNDADTGLVYMQQRYYDPVAGRFLSVDPVTTDANNGSGFNHYTYVKNNPYRYIDPDGRYSVPAEEDAATRRREEAARAYFKKQRITQQRCATSDCTFSENATATLDGVWSIFTGTANSIRFVARGTGLLGSNEKRKWDIESDKVDKFVDKYRADPKFAAQVDKNAGEIAGKLYQESQNGAAKAFMAARAATGIITGLGPAAAVGDTVRGVENGRTLVESLIGGGLPGETN